MKKYIAITIIISLATIGTTYASDCSILVDENKTTKIDANIEAIVSGYPEAYKNVLPTEAFKKALINLKAHCCTKEIKKSCSADDIKNIQLPYPESAYLFDHLLDIAMRRLDGITWLAYNLSPDPTAIERRTKITEIANNANGMPAKTIEDIYIKYRTWHINTTKNIETVIAAYKNNTLETLSLGDKYSTMCEMINKIYASVANSNKTIIWINFFNGCKTIVKERMKRETGYIKILMVQKSNQLFTETTKAYTKKHFVEEKLMALRNLIDKVKDVFTTIVQQAPASKMCSL